MRWFLLLSLPLYLLDQGTKMAITDRFPEESHYRNDSIEVIPGFFHLVRVHNTGMAFGVLNAADGDVKKARLTNLLFLGIATGALVLIGVLWRRGAFPGRDAKAAVALLVSGILGNVTDRMARGYVVDFLDFNLGFMRWPSFNVADACICVAAGILFLASFRGEVAAPGAPGKE